MSEKHFFLNAYICCKSCKEALYTLPLITIRELKRIKTAQKCIFLRTKTNLLQLFSSIYNSQFLWGNILHKPNKYKVLCPNTFKLVAIPKVGQNITSKKIFFSKYEKFLLVIILELEKFLNNVHYVVLEECRPYFINYYKIR